MDEAEIKKNLTPEEYHVLREKGTEAPFSGKYNKEGGDGMYNCKVCDAPLFASDTKFDSGSGWPSFDQAIEGSIKEVSDDSLFMRRTEVVCANCNSHLGHVFDDGPKDTTGRRYCVNSVCLDLKKDHE